MNRKILFIGIASASAVGLAAAFLLTAMGNTNNKARDYAEFLDMHDPSDCTDTRCAQEVIEKCLVGSVTISYGIPLADSLAIVSRGSHDGVCEMLLTTFYGELAAMPPPVYACQIPQDKLPSWVGWRNSAREGIMEVESLCNSDT